MKSNKYWISLSFWVAIRWHLMSWIWFLLLFVWWWDNWIINYETRDDDIISGCAAFFGGGMKIFQLAELIATLNVYTQQRALDITQRALHKNLLVTQPKLPALNVYLIETSKSCGMFVFVEASPSTPGQRLIKILPSFITTVNFIPLGGMFFWHILDVRPSMNVKLALIQSDTSSRWFFMNVGWLVN